ncbi:MAG: ABC transporter ATP-binding protein [Cyanobium sp.]
MAAGSRRSQQDGGGAEVPDLEEPAMSNATSEQLPLPLPAAGAGDHGPGEELQLQGVSRVLGDRALVDSLSLTVAPGECLALLGPSGCGKSTTLRLLAGLDPVSSGSITLGNEEITALAPGRRRVAMVFQSYALYPHLSVSGNLELGLRVRGMPARERESRISAMLELLQLGELRHRRPAQLSGGQRQRVALARALLRQPRLVLLDEPMSNLDAQLREDLRPELLRLLCGNGPPVVYVTHDQQEAIGMADRLAILQAGRLQQVGTARELYERPANLFVAGFLGRPGINLLPPEGDRQLALRPEHLRPSRVDGVPASVLRREWWGAQQLFWLRSGLGELRLLLPSGAELPEPLRVRWNRCDELWFSSSSGERIEPQR